MSEPKFSTVVVMAPGGDVWVSNNVPAGQEYYAIVTLANIEKPKGKPWIRIPAEPPEMPSEILYRGVLAADTYCEAFENHWQSRYGDQYPWGGNPWAFLTTMEVR